ncbi:MAG: hypothetical protein LBN02_10410 [Oscillospiraceae bacterium]|jgi:hypothetical protein|nr:hypothetical protein [Oscillospiraceae bacterium]
MKKLLTLIAAIAIAVTFASPASAVTLPTPLPPLPPPPDAVNVTVILPYSDGAVVTLTDVLPVYLNEYAVDPAAYQCVLFFLPSATVTFAEEYSTNDEIIGAATYYAEVTYPISVFFSQPLAYRSDMLFLFAELTELSWNGYGRRATQSIYDIAVDSYNPPPPTTYVSPKPPPTEFIDITVALPKMNAVATLHNVSPVYYLMQQLTQQLTLFVVSESGATITFEEDARFFDNTAGKWMSFTAGRAYSLYDSTVPEFGQWGVTTTDTGAADPRWHGIIVYAEGSMAHTSFYQQFLTVPYYTAADIHDIEYILPPLPSPPPTPTPSPTAQPDDDAAAPRGITLYIVIGITVVAVIAVVVIAAAATSKKRRRDGEDA